MLFNCYLASFSFLQDILHSNFSHDSQNKVGFSLLNLPLTCADVEMKSVFLASSYKMGNRRFSGRLTKFARRSVRVIKEPDLADCHRPQKLTARRPPAPWPTGCGLHETDPLGPAQRPRCLGQFKIRSGTAAIATCQPCW